MKTSSPGFLSILVFAFSAIFFWLSSAQNASAPVLDATGQELCRGISYYILPAERDNGGGINLASNRGTDCPLLIAQAPLTESNGLPLWFSPINPNDSVIRLSIDLNIKFNSSPERCPQSAVWMLNVSQSSMPLPFVTLGGVEGNPGPNTLSNWLKIERYEDAYQIQYCPCLIQCRLEVLCNVVCGNIGIVHNSGHRRLAFNGETFKIVFQRAKIGLLVYPIQ